MDMINKARYRHRQKKLDQLLFELKPARSERFLEIGVADREYSPVDNFIIKNYPYRENITALGIGSLSEFRRNYPDVRAFEYDGRIFPFRDREFDIAHANAVIEHVGAFDAQVVFLREAARVSRRGMITTPNRFFPVETHTRVPFLHWMDKSRFDALLRLMGKGWAADDYMHLLGYRELELLAKRAGLADYRITRNRFLGLTATFSLIWFDTGR